jgi:hypothetical protein
LTVTTTGYPTASVSDGGASLPNGVTFVDNGDGTATLSGTPDSGTAGSYPFTITASNGVSPDAPQSFTLKVVDPPSGTVAPVLSGSPQVGQQLKTTHGTWTTTDGPVAYSYRWQRCDNTGAGCQAITPAQSHYYYTLTRADLGHQITVAVTATDHDGHPDTVLVSPALGPVTTAAPSNTNPPVISGNSQVGQELLATHGDWTSADGPLSWSYQWQRCDSSGANCQPITSGFQIHHYYYLTKADLGHQITVVVQATDQSNQSSTQAAANQIGPVTTAGTTSRGT